MIERSFKHCGINLAQDGSENSKLNPKLSNSKEMQIYLNQMLQEPVTHPCDDRWEISKEFKETDHAESYEILEKEEKVPQNSNDSPQEVPFLDNLEEEEENFGGTN